MNGLNPTAVILEFLESHDLSFEQNNLNTFLITLPGEKKQQTHCALVIGDHSLSINAFVIRKPDENEDQVRSTCQKHGASLSSQGTGEREVQEPRRFEHWPKDC